MLVFVETKTRWNENSWLTSGAGGQPAHMNARASADAASFVQRSSLRTCFAVLMCLPSKIYADHRIASHKRQRIYVSSFFFVLLWVSSFVLINFCLFLFLDSFTLSIMSVFILVVAFQFWISRFLYFSTLNLCYSFQSLAFATSQRETERKKRKSHDPFSSICLKSNENHWKCCRF